MNCAHKMKRGACKNPVLKNSLFCYLKSHHSNKTAYYQAIETLKKEWISETYPIDLFTKHNAPEDGWCFYYSFGMAILNKFINKTENININSFFAKNDLKTYVEKKDFENKHFRELVTYKVYLIARKWLKDNINDVHDETKEAMCDFIVNMNDVDTVDEYFSEESTLVDIKEELSEEYWGGVCEQYALSKYFKTDIIVFFPTRHSFSRKDKKFSTIISKVVRKNTTRYKLSSGCFGNTSCDKSTILSILQLASEYKNDRVEFFETLHKNLREKTTSDIDNTVFLLLFILDDNDNNVSHYNYLLFKNNIYLKN